MISSISLILLVFLVGCGLNETLVKQSLEHKNNSHAPRVNMGEVISMGRDDDDGNATKWHIGGGEEEE